MTQFERLSRLNDYTVDKHQADPRGWDVINSTGRSIGEVKDLIVDMSTMKAIYLDVELDSKLFDLRGDPHVLIPVERAERQTSGKRLMVPSLDSARVQELCAERAQSYIEFWDCWWQRGQTPAGASWSPTITEQISSDRLRQALDNARPGEQVRIPIINEEIVIERRPLPAGEPAAVRTDEHPVMTSDIK
jgi:hypothetical protein